jgi:threonine dehydratase
LTITAIVTPSAIRSAHAHIRAHIRRTPLLETASPIAGAPPLSLKLEYLQATGSFKARGAFHTLLTRPAAASGCATASGGNHGAAVAFAAHKLGIRARVFVPEIATPAKIAKIKAYGTEAMIGGASYAEAQERCDAYVAESGALSIHPYDAVETIAGQGTVGLEWEEDLERLGLNRLDTVLVAVGGGGLISGVAAWFQGRVKVVGVEPEGSRALYAALEANEPVDVAVKITGRRFARRKAGRQTQFRDRPEIRERRGPGQGHGDRRSPAPGLGGLFGHRRAGWRGGLRRNRERRLPACAS